MMEDLLMEDWERELWADAVLDLFVAFVVRDAAVLEGMVGMVIRAVSALGVQASGFWARHVTVLTDPQRRRVARLIRAAFA